jgi:hypothetical protein
MAIIVPNSGELELLDKMIRDALSVDEDYYLRLYKNDYTPDATSVLGDFTEADFTDYAQKTLTRSGFNAASTNGSGEGEIGYGSEQAFTCGTTGNTVYGYYVVGETSNTVLWCQRFTAARAMANGDVIRITPTFVLRSIN